ncbi:DegT/DnrJ/EryC1/StrS family aminotransferase [Streptomyces sp. NRRL F-5630]|uniref:DegT/DnrJ/EryC1/StrS family aminotransferase n=1 Tax=Streptomyces sp. NRRL F-5630 TaxID=1463864 RepID=UPI003D70A543
MDTARLLRAAGIGSGDEVVISAFDGPEVAEAVLGLGARPLFADIDPYTYNLDAAHVASVLGPGTAAVVVRHRFGNPASLGAVRELGERHGLLVLEHHEAGAERAVPTARAEGARYLDGRLRGVVPPRGAAGHRYLRYVVRVPGNGRPDRDAFVRAARAKGIDCRIPVPTPLHRLPGYRRDVFLPATEDAVAETLALPLGDGLPPRELQRLVSVCNALGGLVRLPVRS